MCKLLQGQLRSEGLQERVSRVLCHAIRSYDIDSMPYRSPNTPSQPRDKSLWRPRPASPVMLHATTTILLQSHTKVIALITSMRAVAGSSRAHYMYRIISYLPCYVYASHSRRAMLSLASSRNLGVGMDCFCDCTARRFVKQN